MFNRDSMAPVIAFFGSRLVIVIGILFSTYIVPNPGLPNDAAGIGSLIHWDAAWYMGIADTGYAWNPDAQSNVIFFPLYPFLSGVLHSVTGFSVPLSMIIVSNGAFLAALVLLYRYLYREFNQDLAVWSVVFLSFFPTSVFFSAGYPESLSLLFSIAAFHFLSKDEPLAASVMAGIATATRLPLIFLSVPIFIHLMRKRFTAKHYIYTLVCLFVSVSGLLAYVVYLWAKFGDPLVFVKGYEAWKPFNPGEKSFLKILMFSPVVRDMSYNLFHFSARTFDSLFFIFFLAASILGVIQYRRTLFTYALIIVLFSYFSHAEFTMISMGRYLLLAFPAFILMTQIFRNAAARASAISASAALLFMFAALFARWHWAG